MTYQPAIYRKHGAAELVVASGGDITVESGGDVVVQSGGDIEIESGGDIVVESGGTIEMQSGSLLRVPYQALGSSQTATAITQSGVTRVTGTTTGPAYTLATPTAAGIWKEIVLNPTSSGATHRCTVFSGSTGLAFGHPTGGTGNTITLNTSAQNSVTLVSLGTSAWHVLRAFLVKDPALSNKST